MKKLHVDSIIKNFGTKQVLTDIFISCHKGEIIGLLGRNGTGKSTLLKIIFGSLSADSKFVRIGEKLSNGIFDNRNLLNYLPQERFLPNHIKVKTIIDLYCDKNNAKRLKEHHLIAPMLSKKCTQLSGGGNRLIETLLIIYADSQFTLLDEPFKGVAPIIKEQIKELIKEQSINKGFIVTDHDYRNILDIATKVVLIHDGGTKEIKSKNELFDWGYIPESL